MTNRDSRVTIHMAASLDGFIARNDGRVDWLETMDEFADGEAFDPAYAEAFLKTIDCYQERHGGTLLRSAATAGAHRLTLHFLPMRTPARIRKNPRFLAGFPFKPDMDLTRRPCSPLRRNRKSCRS